MSVTHAPPTHVRRLHINPWLVAVLALAAGLIVLGTWTILDRSTESKPAAVRIVDDLNAAVNAGDDEAVRALFAPDAVFQVSTGESVTGLDNVVNTVLLPHVVGFRVERVGSVTTVGETSATFTEVSNGTEAVELAVLRLKDGKIVHMWVYDEGYR
jgi:hypothetical protein